MDIYREKEKLRKQISSLKKEFTVEQLSLCSEEVLSVVELTGVFQEARIIFIYNGICDEVQTIDFIRKWGYEKEFYLPVVVNDNLVFRKWNSNIDFKQSSFGILEPMGEDFANYDKVDLVIVPGMAFDRRMNRMGRGKGYYDRFLKKLNAPKMGVCFDFQLLDKIPFDDDDIKMDYLVSENELIW